MTQLSPKRSAYSRFTLNGEPVYVSRACVGPACGFLSHILALPQGTTTRRPDRLATGHVGCALDVLGADLGERAGNAVGYARVAPAAPDAPGRQVECTWACW